MVGGSHLVHRHGAQLCSFARAIGRSGSVVSDRPRRDLVSAIWGVFIWHEFANAPPQIAALAASDV